MSNLTRDFFIGLANNRFLNSQAKKWGFSLGADRFVAGTTISTVMQEVKKLNAHGISCTLDNLGEFVSDKTEAGEAKDKIITLLETIHDENADCHLSIKLTQLGLDIDEDYCMENIEAVLDVASRYAIFINIDMEDYAHFHETIKVVKALHEKYNGVGTVIQTYLREAEEALDELKDMRVRIVKGAYKENADVAYQDKADIDDNFIKLAKARLLNGTFTSFGTHDHHIIDELKTFAADNNIPTDHYEFQMLFGFRTNMHYQIASEGYQFCTYIPFGVDWFGYFMRRLAERPQNMNLVVKDVFYTDDDKLKKGPIIGGAAAISALLLWRRSVKRRKKNNV